MCVLFTNMYHMILSKSTINCFIDSNAVNTEKRVNLNIR